MGHIAHTVHADGGITKRHPQVEVTLTIGGDSVPGRTRGQHLFLRFNPGEPNDYTAASYNAGEANIEYYKRALTDGTHIACFAEIQGEIVGCGGLCLYDEMPSPDNP